MKIQALVQEHLFALVFALIFAFFLIVLWRVFRRWTADANDAFDLRDFIMENGKASATKLWLNGAFGATTWAFVYLVLKDKAGETTLLAYGGLWITPLLGRLVKEGFSERAP